MAMDAKEESAGEGGIVVHGSKGLVCMDTTVKFQTEVDTKLLSTNVHHTTRVSGCVVCCSWKIRPANFFYFHMTNIPNQTRCK